jgi:hypothetical protein
MNNTTAPSNSSPTAILAIKQFLSNGEKIPVKLKDELLFGALLNIYDIQAVHRRDIDRMKPWVGLFKWCVTVLGAAILLLLLSMVTHTFTWPFQ